MSNVIDITKRIVGRAAERHPAEPPGLSVAHHDGRVIVRLVSEHSTALLDMDPETANDLADLLVAAANKARGG